MSNPRWSATRFSTFNTCRNKYKTIYQDQLQIIGRDAELAQKGLAFHHIAENMTSATTKEQLFEAARKHLESVNGEFDQEKYPVIKSILRFYLFWQNYPAKYEKEGYEIQRETWVKNDFVLGDGRTFPFVGALDLLLRNDKEKKAIIVDYKTGASAKISDDYKNQLTIYAYSIAKEMSIPLDEIADRIKCYLFFPLGGLKDIKDAEDEDTAMKGMLKNMKQLIYTKDNIVETVVGFENIIRESESYDWVNFNREKEAQMGFYCSFCSLLGHSVLCPESHGRNFHFPRSAKVYTYSDKNHEKPLSIDDVRKLEEDEKNKNNK